MLSWRSRTPTRRLLLRPLIVRHPWRGIGSLRTSTVPAAMEARSMPGLPSAWPSADCAAVLAVHAIDLLTTGKGRLTEGYMIDSDHVPKLAALMRQQPAR
jgi:hypothetical protein